MTLSFMTFNVRHDHHEESNMTPFAEPPAKEAPFDTAQFQYEQPWSIRKWKIVDTILLYSPDVVGLQEPVHHQVLDIEALLHDQYEWIGAGREDGDKKGEFSAVFYKKDVLTVEDWKTFWLSETPDIAGSQSWDARHPRTATQVTFKKANSDDRFTVFNTHMDHVGANAREQSSKLILERARPASEYGPVFLLGDLNSTEDDPAYLTLTNSKYRESKGKNDTLANLQELNQVCASAYSGRTGEPVRTAENNMTLPTHRVIRPGQLLANLKKQQQEQKYTEYYFEDASYELVTRIDSKGDTTTLSGPFGFRDTLTSFGVGNDSDRAPLRIDFIMPLQSNTFKIKVIQFAVLPNQYDDGLYISDHRPVLARISW
ncbi:Endonuclease/exonuclease/phosphatase [Gilbertella persicaria]|uniref:Endonuclease/exonuclease/phosphatase n=1 Tax=Gilbertella persicaria TaxID=101096 RepID=UPI00222057EB|nr:Endonuclease/exonuclease/phosphatase [Gilbertella persicaria]KAI8047099.1 Endonuclease/exonuclease/phosphatase [Gilbertella persicaria]